MKRHYSCIFISKPEGFHLQRKGIDLSFPKPLCTAELNIIRVHGFKFFERFKQVSSGNAVFYAKGNVGDSVFNFGNTAFCGQGGKVVRIILAFVDKMAITALQGEAIGQAVKFTDEPSDRRVDTVKSKTA